MSRRARLPCRRTRSRSGCTCLPRRRRRGSVSEGELQSLPIWQVPWRQQGPKDPPQLEAATHTAACVFATSAWYFGYALLLIAAFAQLPSPGLQKSPTPTGMQSESVCHDWS
jgi:hypothetical protein